MAFYSTEYSTFVAAKSLADTPFIRSKRSSRATAHSSREHSSSPPPLPSDATESGEHVGEGRYTALDPRRFTPTLHASLVSEILSLRRELDSKNNLVDNLETSLSAAKIENETLHGQVSESAREVKRAKLQVQQMEQGTYDAVEDLVKERDGTRATLEDLRAKFESAQRKARQQDEEAQRTQSIWANDKESWDNERRQLERRIHVTESRLRAVVDEMAAQQSSSQVDDYTDDSAFKDSALGGGSDTGSIHSAAPASPAKHRRNASSVSYRQPRHARMSVSSRTATATPDLYSRPGNTLADELDIDEEDECDIDESEHGDEDLEYASPKAQGTTTRNNSVTSEVDRKAKRVLGTTSDSLASLSTKELPRASLESPKLQGLAKVYQDRATTPPPPTLHLSEPARRVTYVDSGCQPSPPVFPPRVEVTQAGEDLLPAENDNEMRPPPIDTDATLQQPARRLQTKPISPPQTPVVDGSTWLQQNGLPTAALEYMTAATQTDTAEPEPPKIGHTPKRDSLSPPVFVPSIAIHPPSSRPSSPRPYVLPPGTKNAFSQANLTWPSQDASAQTEEIRIDRRPVKLPPHLLPGALLPSPTIHEAKRLSTESKRTSTSTVLMKRESLKRPPAIAIPASPPLQSPVDSSPEMSRNNSSRDLRHFPLKALPLPRPVLSPPLLSQADTFSSNGPLNRSSKYGVSQPKLEHQNFEEFESSEQSDYEDRVDGNEPADLIASMSLSSRPPLGRFGLSEPPKAVPEDKEISPERRPDTADSYAAAPAPSVASSRANSQRRHTQHPSRLGRPAAGKDFRSRSPSFGSIASSSQSAHSGMPLPPYPIPLRSSSRSLATPHSEGSQSPTPYDSSGLRFNRASRSSHQRQVSLRKVQSAAVIRNRSSRSSPTRGHRRRRKSPDLTPVQSMAFDSPAPTKFPIPELSSPPNDRLGLNHTKGSVDLRSSPGDSSTARVSEETELVDAIAGTMVGEWMWKYIRKRKSFGIGDDNSDLTVADESGVINVSTHGTRHKRWVWLSPYERNVMWDTKQPTSGPALLGKKGRKLSIQSVLDVPDETPLPKNPELSTAWNRSIIILTPERALKFTTTTEERHGLWMTALKFLAQSSTQLPNQIPRLSTSKPPMPPLPPPELDGVPIRRHRAPSFGRNNVRDSIRLTKGKKADLQKLSSQPDRPYASDVVDAEAGARNDSADFPAVPRLYISTTRHKRHRSNTNPGVNGLRSLSSGVLPSSASSGPQHRSTNPSSFRPSISTKSGSRRDSLASPLQQNFFEAVGTVRMEAFVDPNIRDGVLYVPAPPPVVGGARRPRRASNLSQSTVDKRRAGYVFDEDGMDPFKGF